MTENQSLLSVPKAAAALGISAHLVRKAVEKGQIRSVEFGDRRMVPVAEIERLRKEWTDATS